MKIKTITVIFAAAALSLQMPILTHSQPKNIAPESFSIFSLPQNIGTTVNSGDSQNNVSIAPNGLSLYFSSNRLGFGSLDLWVSQRPTQTAAWGTPQNLGAVVNSASNQNLPALSPDGKTLFFNCSCPDAFGGSDIYMTTRTDVNNDFGWTAPVNLGAVINTGDNELGAGYFEDPTNGTAILYFTSNRAGGGEDIYQSTRNANGTFNAPTNVAALNSPAIDRGLSVRHDGLEIFISSDRDGGLGGPDIWIATRGSVSAPWNAPVNLAGINSSGTDQSPSVSRDGSVLYLISTRDGLLDIYTATRVSINRAPASDFNGDGRADISVFRPSSGDWWIMNSGDNTVSARHWGSNGDRIVPGDYDGDSRTDLAIFRPSTGTWWISRSSDNSVATINWGISTDRPVPDDYDGDGRTDIAVYRDGTWYIVNSSTGSHNIQQFGLSSDIPISAGVQ
jgi:hypothetical protein